MARITAAGKRVAEHLGLDYEAMEGEYRYQPTQWTKPVYAIGNDYWSAGAKPPENTRSRHFNFDEPWEKVVSSYDGKAVLWHIPESR